MAATPRPTKRRRTTGPSDAVHLDRNASVDDERVDDSDADHNTNSTLAAAPALLDKGKARATDQDALPDEEEGTALPDLEEMERIYDMLAEEYHDSESPSLSLARIHGLELKICPQSCQRCRSNTNAPSSSCENSKTTKSASLLKLPTLHSSARPIADLPQAT